MTETLQTAVGGTEAPARYKVTPAVHEAFRWWPTWGRDCGAWKGLVQKGPVRQYLTLGSPGSRALCSQCKGMMFTHGLVDTKLIGGTRLACPGDWIVLGGKAGAYPLKPDIFEATHELLWPQPQGQEALQPQKEQ